MGIRIAAGARDVSARSSHEAAQGQVFSTAVAWWNVLRAGTSRGPAESSLCV